MVKPLRAMAVLTMAALAVAACGGGSSGGSGGGGGGKTLTISTDLPMQGPSKDSSDSTVNAIKLYLAQHDNKVGDYTIKLKVYDDSTAAKGAWDDAQCAANAQEHVSTVDEVAVMGTFNSGCAKIQVATLNQASDGPMLMVSHANTNVGLTKKSAADPNEPQKYYPSGTRSYARVVTTDDFQGAADADYMSKDLGIKKVYILNDNDTYGQGVAKSFQDQAVKDGMTVIANEPYDLKQPNYTAVMQKIKQSGAEAIFVGGVYDSNGGQLIKDKVAVLGPNSGAVKFFGPDGWTGYPAFLKQPESVGAYLSFPGLSIETLRSQKGAAAKFLDDYKAKYGSDPAASYALYGVSAVQVILAAIAKSDGTRKGVNDAVFSGEGITVPAADSVLGKDIKIDPATGDRVGADLSIELVKGGAETFVKAQPVG